MQDNLSGPPPPRHDRPGWGKHVQRRGLRTSVDAGPGRRSPRWGTFGGMWQGRARQPVPTSGQVSRDWGAKRRRLQQGAPPPGPRPYLHRIMMHVMPGHGHPPPAARDPHPPLKYRRPEQKRKWWENRARSHVELYFTFFPFFLHLTSSGPAPAGRPVWRPSTAMVDAPTLGASTGARAPRDAAGPGRRASTRRGPGAFQTLSGPVLACAPKRPRVGGRGGPHPAGDAIARLVPLLLLTQSRTPPPAGAGRPSRRPAGRGGGPGGRGRAGGRSRDRAGERAWPGRRPRSGQRGRQPGP